MHLWTPLTLLSLTLSYFLYCLWLSTCFKSKPKRPFDSSLSTHNAILSSKVPNALEEKRTDSITDQPFNSLRGVHSFILSCKYFLTYNDNGTCSLLK